MCLVGGCDRDNSGVIKTKINASHGCITYSKMGRKIIQSGEVRSCLTLKVALKRLQERGVMHCNKTLRS